MEEFADLQGDALVWRQTWLADKFCFRIPTGFHEVLFTVKRALGFPPDPQEENAPTPAQSQARLFQGVPQVAVTVCVNALGQHAPPYSQTGHKRSPRRFQQISGRGRFSRKFPAGHSNKASFLTPESIDQEVEKPFLMWIKKDFSAKKPFGSDSSSHLAVAERLLVRLDECLATVNRLSALLIQIQAYIQHAMAEQAKLLQSLRVLLESLTR